jgi:hypothetical protein
MRQNAPVSQHNELYFFWIGYMLIDFCKLRLRFRCGLINIFLCALVGDCFLCCVGCFAWWVVGAFCVACLVVGFILGKKKRLCASHFIMCAIM